MPIAITIHAETPEQFREFVATLASGTAFGKVVHMPLRTVPTSSPAEPSTGEAAEPAPTADAPAEQPKQTRGRPRKTAEPAAVEADKQPSATAVAEPEKPAEQVDASDDDMFDTAPAAAEALTVEDVKSLIQSVMEKRGHEAGKIIVSSMFDQAVKDGKFPADGKRRISDLPSDYFAEAARLARAQLAE